MPLQTDCACARKLFFEIVTFDGCSLWLPVDDPELLPPHAVAKSDIAATDAAQTRFGIIRSISTRTCRD